MSESLYFIAIIPPEPIQEEITQFKHLIAECFCSKHALNSPPHITLHMPFKWKDKKLDQLMEVIDTLNEELESFEIVLKDFDFFEPRVVFVNVVENEQLNQLQKKVVSVCRKQLKLDNANYKNKAFHPHITIGFRDLRKQMFYEAKEEFEVRRFERAFSAEKVEVLKHSSEGWKIVDF